MILDAQQAKTYSEIFASTFNIPKEFVTTKLPKLFSTRFFYTVPTDIQVEVKEHKNNAKLTAQFKKDLEENKPIEKSLELAYHKHNFTERASYEFNDNYQFDLKVTYTKDDSTKVFTYIELKNDRLASTYGNLAIEFFSWGKSSGINTTKAILWVSKVDGFFIVFKVDDLRKAIRDLKPITKAGGDGMASSNFIIPVKKLIDYISYIIVE